MLPTYDNCTRLVRIKNKLKSVVFTNKVGKNSRYFVGVFNKTIFPFALVEYEMIIANSYPTGTRGIIVYYTPVITTQTTLRNFSLTGADGACCLSGFFRFSLSAIC